MVTFPMASAQKESSTVYGKLMIDNDTFIIAEDYVSLLQITGEVKNPQSGVRLDLIISKSDGSTDKIKTIPNSYGEFFTTLLLDANWQEGDYTIKAIYRDWEVGTVSFKILAVYEPEIALPSDVGTITIENEELMKSKGKTVIAKITGTINNYQKDTPIFLNIVKPDSTTKELSVSAKKSGEFTARITIGEDWSIGTYQVSITYMEEEVGTVSFVLKELEVPSWIKNNARWWSEGSIGDEDFVRGIQYMIRENIIVIPNLPESGESGQHQVPDWIRNNAGWWADGLISEDDFVNGIKWLVENGIIKV